MHIAKASGALHGSPTGVETPRELTRFVGPKEKASGTPIMLTTCRHFRMLLGDVRECLHKDATKTLWYCVLFCLRRLPEIRSAYSLAEIREMAAASFDLSEKKLKALPGNDDARRQVENLLCGLGLPTVSATFRFALKYTHERIPQILVQAVDTAVVADPEQSVAEFQRGEPMHLKSLDAPSRDQWLEALASGSSLLKKYGRNLPGFSSEPEIRELIVGLIEDDALTTLKNRHHDRERVKWEDCVGVSSVRQNIATLEERLSDYAWSAHGKPLDPASLKLLKKLTRRLVEARKLIETEMGSRGDARFQRQPTK